ncbi:beta-ketoacyl synthase chain length factor [Flavihumibacter fluvii]|uniref:beta-ketoacyl synthase chain length factor n=1 Tax=Flavihumibacter fluvii TaxID=2838157 RepID=UPI001BDEB5EF|nr:beta-ketoacyl synthase chain length factor [Flavihumibacter fluvii]ULQ54777.1 beta-ketoacyl synthase chain length factor [Flavihumibacter fluvii]
MPASYSAGMIKPVYIRAARAICAQETFPQNELPDQLADATNNTLFYKHPEYSKYFTIMQLRRMSRITRTGLVAAIECLADAGIKKPEAIITGTGKGSITDTEKFIRNIQEFKEGTLNPTPFIQSTYNSLNGLISLHHDTSCYNTTFVHRGHSLELALTDAMLLFNEGSIENALVGSFEEISPEHFIIKQKLGYWKKEPVSCKELLAVETPGSIAGEGTFFFVLQKGPEGAMAKLHAMRLLFEPTEEILTEAIKQLLEDHQLSSGDIDLVFLGDNGDIRHKGNYMAVAGMFSNEVHVQGFKQACGEFDTAAGFALWLAVLAAKNQRIYEGLTIRQGNRPSYKNILIYNNYNGQQHSIYLVQQAH